MPAQNFAPPGAPNAGVHVIKDETLRKLLVEVFMNKAQFDCDETPTSRTYTYRAPRTGGDTVNPGDDFDLVCWPPGEITATTNPEWTLYFRDGIAYVYDPDLGPPDRTLNIHALPVGLTGYVTLRRWRDIDDLAVKYVRFIAGAITELSAGLATDTAPTTWGTELLAINWLDNGTSDPTENWT